MPQQPSSGPPSPQPSGSSDYRLAPALGARLVGLLVIGLAMLVFVATGVVAVLDLHTLVLVPVALLVLAATFGVGAVVRGATVVHFDDEGYRVRLIRGAGVKQASWTDVVEAIATTQRGVRCVVLKLVHDRTTTIPIDAVAGDREAFVRDLQSHLQHGHGLRRLDGR
jgi:hypothetical protein